MLKKILAIVISISMLLSFMQLPIVISAEDVSEKVVLYVSKTGDDANDGLTPETALETINKAISKVPNNEATIYVMGQEVAFQPNNAVANSKMISIEGYDENAILAVYSNQKLKGQFTIKNIYVKSNFNSITSNGYELILDVKQATKLASQSSIGGVGVIVGNSSSRDENVTIVNNTKPASGTAITDYYIGLKDGTNTMGGVDFVHQAGNIRGLYFNSDTTFTGDVNITFDSFSQYSGNNGLIEEINGTPVFQKALQVIYNNNCSASITTEKVFETDAVSATGGKWVIYGGKDVMLRTTETAGTFKVSGKTTATATNVKTDEVVYSNNGTLDLEVGVWNVEGVCTELYVSKTGSDETGDGLTPETAFGTINKALELVPNNKATIYVIGQEVEFRPNMAKVVNTEMITIEGYEENSILSFGYEASLKGPFTIKNIMIKQNGNTVTTNGYEFILDVQKAGKLSSQTNQSASGLIVYNTTGKDEKVTIVNYTAATSNATTVGAITDYYIGHKSTASTMGGVNFVHEAGELRSFYFKSNTTFTGNVNITVDSFTQVASPNGYSERVGGTPVFQKAFQMIYNNNTAASIKTERVFSTDAITATEGRWIIEGGIGVKLRATDYAGTFSVEDGKTVKAIDINDPSNVYYSQFGELTVPAGTYKVIEIALGDANVDGAVNVADLVAIKEIISYEDYDPFADINTDGEVDALDTVLMIKYLLGVIKL